MGNFAAKFLNYLIIGIIVVPLSIITHEAGHFFMYHLFGASNIQLHSVSVSADKELLSNFQLAAVNIVGPLITYLTIGLAVFFTRKRYIPFLIILGLAAPLGRVVNFVYIYFRVLGYNPNPNFDEFNFSRNLNIEPLYLAVFTSIIVLMTLFFFFKKAWRAGKYNEIIAVILSLVCDIFMWIFLGGLILP